MRDPGAWVDDANAALLTDLYELTMLEAYLAEGMRETAVFDLFVRSVPPSRSYLLACGLEDALRYLERVAFAPDDIDYLAGRGTFSGEFLDYLRDFRFTGDVRAVAEGTPIFGGEPILEVAGPLPEAQLVETFLMNQVHFQTLIASKVARVVSAARGRPVVEFGLRRMHGTDAGLKAARAGWIAGLAATSNVLAGKIYGIPISGTMAHSYVQAHATEEEAFRAFARIHPDAVLLVDTYDTVEGVRRVAELKHELGEGFRPRAVRLDSGDMDALARAARRILDDAGLRDVEIFASGGLDEHAITELLDGGAPIDGFGVGSRMGVSADAPYLDIAYKLAAYAGEGRMKLSTAKATLPGRKQVFRLSRGLEDVGDVIGVEGEDPRAVAAAWRESGTGGGDVEARPLLVPVMAAGKRLPAGSESLEQARERARAATARLPARLRRLERADPAYPTELSVALRRERDRLRRDLRIRVEAS